MHASRLLGFHTFVVRSQRGAHSERYSVTLPDARLLHGACCTSRAHLGQSRIRKGQCPLVRWSSRTFPRLQPLLPRCFLPSRTRKFTLSSLSFHLSQVPSRWDPTEMRISCWPALVWNLYTARSKTITAWSLFIP